MHLISSLIKWVFSLHQLAWFISGGLSFSAITYFYMKSKQNKKGNRLSFTFIVLSALTLAFTILWTYDSYIENEVRAANMGLIVFGGLAVVFAIIAYRLANTKDKSLIKAEIKES